MRKVGFHIAIVFASWLSLSVPGMAQPAPAFCSAPDLSLALDDEAGEFAGVSQSGTLLVLRNIGPNACQVAARPTLIFEDDHQRPLPISLRTPPGMHPGPVLLPVILSRDAEATGKMHWVSGEVFDANNCVTPAVLAVQIGQGMLRTPFGRQICGPASQHPPYDLTILKPDPVYLSADTIGGLLPAGIATIISGYGDQCLRLGSALRSGDRPRMMTADLDGDGKPDYVLNPQNLQCGAAATTFCGNGGCNITVALSRDGYQNPITIMGGQPTIAQKEDGTDLEVWVSGANCKNSGRAKACWSILSWKDGKASTRYEVGAINPE
jgi:hypothetical protein